MYIHLYIFENVNQFVFLKTQTSQQICRYKKEKNIDMSCILKCMQVLEKLLALLRLKNKKNLTLK